jgi:hypothetical protein
MDVNGLQMAQLETMLLAALTLHYPTAKLMVKVVYGKAQAQPKTERLATLKQQTKTVTLSMVARSKILE